MAARKPEIRVKRVYEPASPSDGTRILVDRLWPRGVSRERAQIDHWAKDVAPSHELRKSFAHDPERWDEFRRRYFAELNERQDAVEALRQMIGDGKATLLFAAREETRNNALALKEFLEAG